MFSNKSKYLVAGGFAAVLMIVLAVTVLAYTRITSTVTAASALVSLQHQKTNLLMSMYSSVRERSVLLLTMLDTDDAFELDAQFMRFNSLSSQYTRSRQALYSLLTGSEEQAFYHRQRELIEVAQPLLGAVVELLLEDRREEALRVLHEQALPSQQRVLELLEQVLESQQRATDQAIENTRQESRRTLVLLGLLLLAAALLAISIAVFVVRRISRANEALFAEVTLEAIGDAVIVSDRSGAVSYLNEQAQTLLGIGARQALGQPLENVFSCAGHAATDGQYPVWITREGCLKVAHGSCITIEYSLSPIRDRNQQVLGAVTVFRDITARKQMEDQLRCSEERFSVVMQGTNDGVWDYNLKSGEIYLSPRWKEMLGYDDQHFANSFHAWQSHIHPADLGNILEVWTECMSGKSDSFTCEYRMQTREGDWIWIECRGLALVDTVGFPVRLAGSHTDISQRKGTEQQLLWNSSHDSLTGLINRSHFEMRLDQLMKSAHRSSLEHALLYIDLDQFKVVNDTCGHIAGDELLRQVSALLVQSFRGSDLVARLGGDEFGIILEDCSVRGAMKIGETVRETIKDYRFAWDNKVFEIGASIGVAPINQASASRIEVLSAADIACYAAKDLGRNRVHLYTEGDDQLEMKHREMRWVSRISKAIEDERFVLWCQPIMPVEPLQSPDGTARNKPLLREILVRMLDEKGELVPPGFFIPAAERYNLMPTVDRWVVRNLFARLQQEAECGAVGSGVEAASVITTVNLSGGSINDAGFLRFVRQQIQTYNIRPQSVCFEITETMAIANLTQATAFINALREIGCRFALDDFGSGLSSFGYLKNMPVDYLKIDGQFIKDMERDPIDAAMVRSINEIGQVMGMQTIAEFVENDATLDHLVNIGVDYAQGYGIARPLPLDELFARERRVAT